jgi:hypothetical protein
MEITIFLQNMGKLPWITHHCIPKLVLFIVAAVRTSSLKCRMITGAWMMFVVMHAYWVVVLDWSLS